MSWRVPVHDSHEILVLGPPRSEKVPGPDGRERLRSSMLVEANGEVQVWEFGASVFKQLQKIRGEHDLHNVRLEVRRTRERGIPRIQVLVLGPRAR